MPNKEEQKRRKALRRQVDQRERAEAEAALPLSKPDLRALLEHVEAEVESEGCDHSLRHTHAFLSERGLSEAKVLPWLRSGGGYCDCEVAANVGETWEGRL